MGCLTTEYGPVVISSCSCLNVTSALQFRPSAPRAQKVNVAPASTTMSDSTPMSSVLCQRYVRSSAHERKWGLVTMNAKTRIAIAIFHAIPSRRSIVFLVPKAMTIQ